MPKSIHVDHHDTAYYIPMYNRTQNVTEREREIYKSLKHRLFHEGRVVDPSYLENQPNLRPTFANIGFNCLLNINKKICLIFILQFYKSVRLIRNLNGTLSIAFIIRNVKITFRLEEFSRILHVPYRGICVYTSEWAISSLPNGIDSNPDIYPPPHEDPLLIRDAIFNPRPPSKTRKVKGVDITLDPFQMVISELKTNFKKWEIILSENVISLTRNKDHPNACLCYMLYCLATGKHFNLAYYIVNRMVSVTKSANMSLPYGMLLTRLVEHVRVSYPHAFSDDLYVVDHVMIPLSERRVFRIMPSRKRPHLLTPTPSGSSESNSSSSRQEEENDPLNNFTLDLIPYINQLPPIEGGESLEFKKTKGCSNALVISYLT
ncbi:hypothetical protein Tco_0684852 [Tanacetum coccineum]